MKKSIYEVDKQDTQEAYMTTGIVSKNGSSATFGFYDTDGTLERISACPLEAIGFRSVGANFGTEHLENMSRLAARYNAVNGDDFMMVAPASATYYGRTTMLSVYVQPEGTGSKTFRDELEAMVRLAQGYDPKIIALDKVTAYMPDEASRRAFLANPTFDAALEAMDKAAGLDSKAMDAGPFPTEDEVMAVIKARTNRRYIYLMQFNKDKMRYRILSSKVQIYDSKQFVEQTDEVSPELPFVASSPMQTPSRFILIIIQSLLYNS